MPVDAGAFGIGMLHLLSIVTVIWETYERDAEKRSCLGKRYWWSSIATATNFVATFCSRYYLSSFLIRLV